MLFRKFAFVIGLMVLVLAASGCVAIPAASTSSGASTPGAPGTEVQTAAAPTVEPPTATAARTVAVQPTLTATATSEAATTVEPSATAPSATSSGTYRGPNPYRATPAFEVTFDPAAWAYVEDDGSGRPSQLKHRVISGCALWLRAGPVDAKEVGQVYLAERAWSVAQVQPNVIQYVSPQDDVAFIFGVLLNEEYSGMANSACQDAAEQVIDTFTVVTE